MKPLLDAMPRSQGHLARLIERARPGDTLLQRRQPSRFEPAQPWAAAPVVDEEVAARPSDTAQPAPPSAPASAAPASPPHASKQDEAATPRRPDAAAPVAEIHRQELRVLRETLRVDRSIVMSATPAPIAERPSRETHVEGEAPVDAPQRAMARQPAIEAPLPRSPARGEASTAASPASPLPRQGALALPPPAAPAAPMAAPLLRPPPAPVVRRPERPAQAAAPSAPRRMPSAPSRPSTTAEAPPPVQVTIGRIEVRAVAAAPAPAPSRRAAPRLSLEQYLQDRHGGRG